MLFWVAVYRLLRASGNRLSNYDLPEISSVKMGNASQLLFRDIWVGGVVVDRVVVGI